MPVAIFAAVTDQGAGALTDPGTPGHLYFQGSTTVGPIIVDSITAYTTYRSGTAIFAEADVLQNASGDGRTAMGDHPRSTLVPPTTTFWTDIAMSSSEPNTTDADHGWASKNLKAYAICRDGVVFIVNDSVTGIENLSKDQIADIYNGRYTNWNQIYDAVTGAQGPNLTIVPRSRKIGSGTRAAFIDSAKTTNHNLTFSTVLGVVDADPAFDPAYIAGTYTTENVVRVQSNQPRLDENVQMQAAIDQDSADGQCGYVGLGFDTGTHIKAIKIMSQYTTGTATFTNGSANVVGSSTVWTASHVGKKIYAGTTGIWYTIASFTDATHITLTTNYAGSTATTFYTLGITAFPATGPTIYSGSYPFSRFLYLATNVEASASQTNYTSDIKNYIDWIKRTETGTGLVTDSGQSSVVEAGFLRLVPNQDIDTNNGINVLDLISVGNKVGKPGPYGRTDVDRNGSVNVLDLISVGNWVITTIVPVPAYAQ